MPKILAIDDKKDNLISLSALLKALIPGCQVITAQSGADGLKKAAAELPDTILLDIKMPGMDGYEVCKRLKKSASTKHIPVIMISAVRTEAIDLVKGLDAGADAYLAKPIDECILAAQVKTALRVKASEDQLRRQKDLLENMVQERTQALRESEKKYRTMMESMSDPVYICSQDFRVEYMNPTMIKRTGRDATGEQCFKALHDLNEPCPWCSNKGDSHGKVFESDVLSPKDNRHYHVSHSPIVNEDGSVSSMIIFRDTTELKKMEAQLLQSQKMESIGKLAGGIAHDFNNILTVINIHSEVAQMELKEGSDVWIDVEEIRKAGERAANLTRQLLAFSRKQMIMPRSVNINKLIADLEKMLARLISEDIRLETTLDEQVGRIFADPGQLDQVIINLVVNASDAVKKQPDSAERTIKVSTSQVFMDNDYVAIHEGSSQGWHLLLQVEDSGCGMTEEVRDHIFEPFYTTKAVGEGTGMGLATVYGIVKQNKGSIYVYSEPEQGTIFKVFWPIVEEEVVAKGADHELQPSKGGSEVILLAEDSKPIREIASRQLRKAGYTVIDAADGREALEKAAVYQGAIDLLFTDVVMPVMGGKELSEKIKELYPDILTLFASGYTDSDIHQDILTLDKNHFINKPFNNQDILIRIRQLLDNKES